MIYSENDIAFESISANRFEEVCFDLLTRLGFQALRWRRGGADKGRDIEGEFRVFNPLVDHYVERWFFECKNQSGGVPVGNMSTKFEWATAGRADHLVFFLVPYPTTNCRDWLEQMKEQVRYKVHVLEEKRLRALILGYPDLIEHHFLNRVEKVFKNSFTDWRAYSLLPDLQRFFTFCTELDPRRLSLEELVFLLDTYLETRHAPHSANLQEAYRHVRISPLVDEICRNAGSTDRSVIDELEPVEVDGMSISETDFDETTRRVNTIDLSFSKGEKVCRGSLIQIMMDPDQTLQVLVGRTGDEDGLELDVRLHLGIPSDITGLAPSDRGDLLKEWWK